MVAKLFSDPRLLCPRIQCPRPLPQSFFFFSVTVKTKIRTPHCMVICPASCLAINVQSVPDVQGSCEQWNQKLTLFPWNHKDNCKCSLNLTFPFCLLPEAYDRHMIQSDRCSDMYEIHCILSSIFSNYCCTHCSFCFHHHSSKAFPFAVVVILCHH